MQQKIGDLFTTPCDVICIPTNGEVNSKGKAIMGAGIALEAKRRWPETEIVLGKHLQKKGNVVHVIWTVFVNYHIMAFPTKNKWREKSDIKLIRKSAKELVRWIDFFHYKRVLLPRVGCGKGNLKWEDVEAVLEPIFDDRFIIVTREEA